MEIQQKVIEDFRKVVSVNITKDTLASFLHDVGVSDDATILPGKIEKQNYPPHTDVVNALATGRLVLPIRAWIDNSKPNQWILSCGYISKRIPL